MRILVIDDERDLSHLFKPEDDVTHVKNASEAMDAVIAEPFDEVWFDHDLGNGSGGGDPRMDTAYPVAVLLAESVCHDTDLVENVKMCVIHTANPVGRAHFELLSNRWGIPFRHHYL